MWMPARGGHPRPWAPGPGRPSSPRGPRRTRGGSPARPAGRRCGASRPAPPLHHPLAPRRAARLPAPPSGPGRLRPSGHGPGASLTPEPSRFAPQAAVAPDSVASSLLANLAGLLAPAPAPAPPALPDPGGPVLEPPDLDGLGDVLAGKFDVGRELAALFNAGRADAARPSAVPPLEGSDWPLGTLSPPPTGAPDGPPEGEAAAPQAGGYGPASGAGPPVSSTAELDALLASIPSARTFAVEGQLREAPAPRPPPPMDEILAMQLPVSAVPEILMRKQILASIQRDGRGEGEGEEASPAHATPSGAARGTAPRTVPGTARAEVRPVNAEALRILEGLGAAEEMKKAASGKLTCPYNCGQSFKHSSERLRHVRQAHTGERPFKCREPGCTRAFFMSKDLKAHMRTHSGERPYVCDTCEAAFKTRGALNGHLKTMHTSEGERPFKCTVPGCDASFKMKKNLVQHVKSKHLAPGPAARARPGAPSTAAGPSRVASGGDEGKAKNASLELAKMWTCSMPGCGASYVKRGDLTEHYKSVHMEGERWKCSVPGCGASFSYYNKAKLKQHILQKHAAPGPVVRASPGAPSTAAGPSRVASGGDEGKAMNASLELAKMWKKKYEKARKKVEKLKAKLAGEVKAMRKASEGRVKVGRLYPLHLRKDKGKGTVGSSCPACDTILTDSEIQERAKKKGSYASPFTDNLQHAMAYFTPHEKYRGTPFALGRRGRAEGTR